MSACESECVWYGRERIEGGRVSKRVRESNSKNERETREQASLYGQARGHGDRALLKLELTDLDGRRNSPPVSSPGAGVQVQDTSPALVVGACDLGSPGLCDKYFTNRAASFCSP